MLGYVESRLKRIKQRRLLVMFDITKPYPQKYMVLVDNACYAMVTNHLRAPYGVYFTKNRRIMVPGRRQQESYDC